MPKWHTFLYPRACIFSLEKFPRLYNNSIQMHRTFFYALFSQLKMNFELLLKLELLRPKHQTEKIFSSNPSKSGMRKQTDSSEIQYWFSYLKIISRSYPVGVYLPTIYRFCARFKKLKSPREIAKWSCTRSRQHFYAEINDYQWNTMNGSKR